jgi:hypothetical protein
MVFAYLHIGGGIQSLVYNAVAGRAEISTELQCVLTRPVITRRNFRPISSFCEFIRPSHQPIRRNTNLPSTKGPVKSRIEIHGKQKIVSKTRPHMVHIVRGIFYQNIGSDAMPVTVQNQNFPSSLDLERRTTCNRENQITRSRVVSGVSS